MSRIFRRSILWLVPVVVIPLVALLGVQYRFLRTLETKTVSAQRSWLRDSSERAANDVDRYYRGAAAHALTIERSCICQERAIGAHFAQTPVRGARSFFVVHFDGQHAYYSWFSPSGGIEKVPSADQDQAVRLATVAWHVAHEMKSAVPHPPLLVDERDEANRIIMRPVVDDKQLVLGVAGVILDEHLARAAIRDIGTQSLAAHDPEDAPGLRILIEDHAVPDPDFRCQPLTFVFTKWRLGVRNLCTTPEQLGALTFKNNMLLGGGVMVVLFGAIGMAIQAASRQMKLSQMKSDFVSNVSHELRTPLASIRVFGEYMRLGRVTTETKVREYGEYIEAESRRLTALINNILDFSKIESSQKKYKMIEADIVELAYDTTCAFAMPLRENGYDISFTAPAAPLPPLIIDRDAIAQVLVNLLDNAVKYSNGDKRIGVTVSSDGESVRVGVRDHGIGIPAAEQKKIFEKFYRVGSGLVHDVKGSGLGLAIVAHVVKAHGGRIDVVSAPGQGSTFTIVLPRGAVAPVPKPNVKETEAA